MTWNYRVVAEIDKSGHWYFSIRDVYYEDGVPHSWGSKPEYPISEESVNELFRDWDNMFHAFTKPLVVVKGNKMVEIGGSAVCRGIKDCEEIETKHR